MLYLGLTSPFHFSFQGVLRQLWFGTDLMPFYSIEEDVQHSILYDKTSFSTCSDPFMLCFFILAQKKLVQGCCFDINLVPVCFVGQLICAPFRFMKQMCLKFDLNFYIENTENLMVELILTSEKCYYVGSSDSVLYIR
jgi:hypothetical protein